MSCLEEKKNCTVQLLFSFHLVAPPLPHTVVLRVLGFIANASHRFDHATRQTLRLAQFHGMALPSVWHGDGSEVMTLEVGGCLIGRTVKQTSGGVRATRGQELFLDAVSPNQVWFLLSCHARRSSRACWTLPRARGLVRWRLGRPRISQ